MLEGITKRLAIGISIGALLLASVPAVATSPTDPAYIVGYATAALERSDTLQEFSIEYRAPVLHVFFAGRPDVPYDAILRQLREIEGVDVAEIHVAGVSVARSPALTADAPPVPSAEHETTDPAEPEEASKRGASGGYDFFLINAMFDPLLADPRWPRFSASYLWFLEDEELERVGGANFGETFVLARSPRAEWGQWEIGFQAGVFSVFDLEASSSDLVNSDFLVGLSFIHHFGDLNWLVRVYHQSSHLGDEYLLRNRVDRVNLSLEVLDSILSFDILQWLRIYGGGGVMIHREPKLDRGILQAGLELSSPVAFASGYLRPIAAVDLQLRQESDWKTDASVRAGVRIEHPTLRRSNVLITADFYTGRSPNGQFYERRITTIGLGAQLAF